MIFHLRHSVLAATLFIVGAHGGLHAQVANAGPDQYICGDTTYLQGNLPGVSQAGTWSVFSGSATFADATYAGTQVTGLAFGDNELVWSVTDGVSTATDTVLVVAYDPLAPQAWTMGDTAITAPPFTIPLTANPFAYPEFCQWTIVSGTASILQPNLWTTSAIDLGPGTTVFQWSCNNGPCGVSISQVLVVVYFISTGVTDMQAIPPFSLEPGTGQLVVSSTLPIDGLVIHDVLGHEVPRAIGLRDGLYIVSARIGGQLFAQRFVVSR